jgi:hypothetical protein
VGDGRAERTDHQHSYRRASPLRRASAFALDLALFFLLFAIGWLVLTWVLASRGQTPGKALTRTFVTRTDGTPLGAGWLMLREVVLKFVIGPLTFEISTMIGGLQVWWSGSPWWDRVVGSVVLERAGTVATERPSDPATQRSLASSHD